LRYFILALFFVSNTALSLPESRAVENYRVVIERCFTRQDSHQIGLRRWQQEGRDYVLLVNASTLETSVKQMSDVRCVRLSKDQFLNEKTRYSEALKSQWLGALDPENAGIHRPSRDYRGSFVTIDLCPSKRNLDQEFFERLKEELRPSETINIAVSGKWIESHRSDFAWLRDQEKNQRLAIHWLNHSWTHPYVRGVPNSKNFLLTPGVDFESEVLETEKILLNYNVVPSVFFRFPGLVANEALMARLTEFGLVAVGSDAWIGKGESPKPGSVVLLHGNGNETKALSKFLNYLMLGQVSFPMRSLIDFEF
jgi:hypothetical protein